MVFRLHYPDRRRREKALLVGALAALAFAGGPAGAQPAPHTVDPQHTRVHWEVRHFGTSTARGRFDDVAVRLSFDPEARTGDVAVEVATASVDTGVPALDAVLRGEHFFASRSNPTAWFVSRRFRFDGDRLAAVDGELTVRDRSVPLTLTARRFGCGPRPGDVRTVCGGDFEAELRRSSLDITYGLPFVADRVVLVVQVEAFAPEKP